MLFALQGKRRNDWVGLGVLVLQGLFRDEEKQFVKGFRYDLLLVCVCA